ncbi:hypothetical protein QUB08_12330 [Microcoleus sp. BR0-C5]|uniref:hypothetical protein n=1 Tax=Microcoleus sp. BR0-C5 TaxID=2818713 RepID=UPI002FD064A9
MSGKEFDSSRSAFKLNYSNRFRRLENRLQLVASFAERSRRLLGPNCTFIPPSSGHPSDRVKWHEEIEAAQEFGIHRNTIDATSLVCCNTRDFQAESLVETAG